ncbi:MULTISPECIES: glycosyltransferase family 2 protein [Nitrosomonas]|uniref:glycosyltransferase family 2 protein n=3 Tax=Nitrosomonadaceae TaxID=206379 RepID=UPI00258C60A9|nr:glycosyltransferase family 2 protein [Nitrosomonas sp.]
MNQQQKALYSYIKASKYEPSSFIAAAIIDNAKVGNIIIAEKLYSQLIRVRDIDIDLLIHVRKLVDRSRQKYKVMNEYLHDSIPKISVIVPFYNRKDKILGCINSVLNQSFGDIEIIAVDDGSTDGGNEILLEITDPRLVIIRNEKASGNSGAPRNIALKIARGEYIAFVDSDDCVELNYFSELYQCIVKNNADIAFSKWFKKINYQNGRREESKIYYKYIDRVRYINYDSFFINSFVIWDKIYRRELFHNNLIYLSESKIGADTLMIAKTYYYAKNVCMCDNKSAYKYFAFSHNSVSQLHRKNTGNLIEEDRPYREVFLWIDKFNISKDYALNQWFRRFLSLSYCLKSSNYESTYESKEYLKQIINYAPIEMILMFCDRVDMQGHKGDIKRMIEWSGIKEAIK